LPAPPAKQLREAKKKPWRDTRASALGAWLRQAGSVPSDHLPMLEPPGTLRPLQSPTRAETAGGKPQPPRPISPLQIRRTDKTQTLPSTPVGGWRLAADSGHSPGISRMAGHFSFGTPLAGQLCGNSRGQYSLRRKVAQPHRPSSLAGARNRPVRGNGHGSSLRRASTAPRPRPSFRRCALRSSLRYWDSRS